MSSADAKSSKHGNRKDWCATYTMRGTRLRNKIAKIQRHLRRLPADLQAKRALKAIQT